MPRHIDNDNQYQYGGIWGISIGQRMPPRGQGKMFMHALLAIVVSLFCSPFSGYSQTSGTSLVIKHELGETILPAAAKRVVALEYSFVDALAFVEVSPVGIADDRMQDRIIPEVRSRIKPWISVGTRKQPSLAAIAALKPDLIIADLRRHQAVYPLLSKIAPTIVLKSLGESYRQHININRVIAKSVGKSEEFYQQLNSHTQRMHEWKAKIAKDESRKILFGFAWEKGFHLHTKKAFVPSIFVDLQIPYFDVNTNYGSSVKLSLEQLFKLNPDVIFMAHNPSEKVAIDRWTTNILWQNINAVKGNTVFSVRKNLWGRARGIIASEIIVSQLIAKLYEQDAK